MADWLNHTLWTYKGDQSWKALCAQKMYDALVQNVTTAEDMLKGFVTQGGETTGDLSKIWGINMRTCDRYCSWNDVGTVGVPWVNPSCQAER